MTPCVLASNVQWECAFPADHWAWVYCHVLGPQPPAVSTCRRSSITFLVESATLHVLSAGLEKYGAKLYRVTPLPQTAPFCHPVKKYFWDLILAQLLWSRVEDRLAALFLKDWYGTLCSHILMFIPLCLFLDGLPTKVQRLTHLGTKLESCNDINGFQSANVGSFLVKTIHATIHVAFKEDLWILYLVFTNTVHHANLERYRKRGFQVKFPYKLVITL